MGRKGDRVPGAGEVQGWLLATPFFGQIPRLYGEHLFRLVDPEPENNEFGAVKWRIVKRAEEKGKGDEDRPKSNQF